MLCRCDVMSLKNRMTTSLLLRHLATVVKVQRLSLDLELTNHTCLGINRRTEWWSQWEQLFHGSPWRKLIEWDYIMMIGLLSSPLNDCFVVCGQSDGRVSEKLNVISIADRVCRNRYCSREKSRVQTLGSWRSGAYREPSKGLEGGIFDPSPTQGVNITDPRRGRKLSRRV